MASKLRLLEDDSTVAARIRQFQDVSSRDTQSHGFEIPPRVFTQVAGHNTTFGHGKRTELDFASPAGRASRDGNEGLRGDNRPPVATPSPRSDAETLYGRAQSTSRPRPYTSFGDYRSELSDAKSRLRPTVRKSIDNSKKIESTSNQGQHKRSTTRSEVFAELEGLLDDAIEETSAVPSERVSAPQSPRTLQKFGTVKSSPPARVKSLNQRVTRLTDQHHVFSPRDIPLSPDRDRSLPKSPHSEVEMFREKSLVMSQNVQTLDATDMLSSGTSISSGHSSPVKERAAMFERMASEARSSIQLHEPPIPLALPQILRRHESSCQQPRERHDLYLFPKPQSLHSDRPTSAIRSTMSATDSPNGIPLPDAPTNAEQQKPATDHGPPPVQRLKRSSTSTIKERVANLFAVARGERPQGLVQVHEQRQQFGSLADFGSQRVPPLQLPVQEQADLLDETDDHKPGPRSYKRDIQPVAKHSDLSRRGIPPASITVTPRQPSSAEKEVAFSSIVGPRLGSSVPVRQSASPPVTPTRGRTLKRRPHLDMNCSRSIGGGVEQQFSLSRSQSRNNGVRVSIELKSSPEREGNRDEAIVVVRARVAD